MEITHEKRLREIANTFRLTQLTLLLKEEEHSPTLTVFLLLPKPEPKFIFRAFLEFWGKDPKGYLCSPFFGLIDLEAAL